MEDHGNRQHISERKPLIPNAEGISFLFLKHFGGEVVASQYLPPQPPFMWPCYDVLSSS
jgi:hypothetical protein